MAGALQVVSIIGELNSNLTVLAKRQWSRKSELKNKSKKS
jgi:hypothetical protein